jgi:hypothetical protein
MERKSRQLTDDDFCFDSSPGQAQRSSFIRTAVRRNHETGEIQGWQEFYRLVCMDDPSKQDDMQINMATQ